MSGVSKARTSRNFQCLKNPADHITSVFKIIITCSLPIKKKPARDFIFFNVHGFHKCIKIFVCLFDMCYVFISYLTLLIY
jgi:hypothetical protein